MESIRFYICEHCGNIITKLRDSGVKVVCCGEPMVELIPNTTDAAVEKHVPVYTRNGDILQAQVGSVEHPMLPEHHIEWICLQTDRGMQFARLEPGDAPRASFALADAEPVALYAYCNLHGLWKADVR